MNKKYLLILGDVLAIALLTIIGFATHGETGATFLPRMGAAFFPVVFSWFVLAPWFGLFDEQIISQPKNLLRIPLAVFFAAPTAVILRAAWFNTAGIPIFALALGGTNALGMMVWRWVYIQIAKRISN